MFSSFFFFFQLFRLGFRSRWSAYFCFCISEQISLSSSWFVLRFLKENFSEWRVVRRAFFYSIMALNGFYSLTQAHDRIRLQMCSLFISLSLTHAGFLIPVTSYCSPTPRKKKEAKYGNAQQKKNLSGNLSEFCILRRCFSNSYSRFPSFLPPHLYWCDPFGFRLYGNRPLTLAVGQQNSCTL